MEIWQSLYQRAKKNKNLIIPGLLALLNGYKYKLLFFIKGKNIKIGKAFRVYGKFYIKGMGKITIGDNCFIISDLIKPVAFMTSTEVAKIYIGNNVGFNGTTIQCYKNIVVKDWCNIADAYIVDSQAHHLSADRRFRDINELNSLPVIIEENVWISTNVVISYGVKIGKK